jgi:hypothetical protein
MVGLHGRAPHCLIVPEQLERLLSVRYASDMEQQADVEDVSNLALRQSHPPRHSGANQTRAQCRFDRQAVCEIGNNRKTTEEIGKSKPFTHRSIDRRHSNRVRAARRSGNITNPSLNARQSGRSREGNAAGKRRCSSRF